MSKYDDQESWSQVTGYVSTRGRDGSNITGDTLGPGGRRRDDGTLSAMVEGIELVEDDEPREQEEAGACQVQAAKMVGLVLAGIAGGIFISNKAPALGRWVRGRWRALTGTQLEAPAAEHAVEEAVVEEADEPDERLADLIELYPAAPEDEPRAQHG